MTNRSFPSFLRRLVLVLLLVAAAVAARLWDVDGLTRPVRVVSGSMTPALRGPHFRFVCGECQAEFNCDAQQRPRDDRVVCPSCGSAEHSFPDQPSRGERVLVDRGALRWSSPRRWSLLAFRRDDSSRWETKRLVGLPRESVSIRHGDLYVDGRVARKTLDQFRRMAILVHDAARQPSDSALKRRWRVDKQIDHGGGEFTLGGSAASSMQWLRYHHWRCAASALPRESESPVLDNYGANQSTSRELRPVGDLLLSCELRIEGDGVLGMSLHDGRVEHRVEYELGAAPRLKVFAAGRLVARRSLKRPPGDGRWELAVVDRRLLAAVNGRLVLSRDLGEGIPDRPVVSPAAIGARRLRLRATRVSLWRDVHYLHPLGLNDHWEGETLGDGQFLVLGDNSPNSQDSRHFGPLAAERLLGTVWRLTAKRPGY